MSRPGPYQGEPGRQPHGRPQQPHDPYRPPPQRPDPRRRDPYGHAQYQPDPYQQPHQPPPPREQYREPARDQYRDRPRYDDDGGGGFRFRVPGLGLLLTMLGLVVQVLCLLLLPWLSASAADGETLSLPELRNLVSDAGAAGFGGWYLVLFTYPLAALGVLLALTSVLESVAMKFVWAGLAILGVGYLVLRYGLLQVVGDGGLDLTRQEITTLLIAVGVLVLVVFMLRTAMVMFRRVAGLVLLVIAGVHIYAVQDFSGGEALSLGAYGPALGYVLSGVAALVGPRRLTPG